MKQNDNTLGAPTEGLGQKVTFAFDPASGGSSLEGGTFTPVRAGVRGAGTQGTGQTRATGVTAPRNTTLDIIMDVAGAVMKPQIEKRRQEAFFNGMQRAMQGEAVADIAENQPWYAKVFGDSDVVEGARAYASNTVAQTTLSSMEDQMGELRKMPPKEAQAYFNKAVEANLTGDKGADANILQAFTRSLPSVMRRQAKEHYGWQQENASAQQRASFMASAKGLQDAASGFALGTRTQEEFDLSRSSFEMSILPAFGQDEKNYLEGIKDLAQHAASEGWLHALDVIKSGGKNADGTARPGVMSALTSDQQRAVLASQDMGERKAILRYTEDHAAALAEIEYKSTIPPEGHGPDDLKVEIDAFNQQFMRATGSTRPAISGGMQAAMLKREGTAIAQERARQQAAIASEAAKIAKAGDVRLAKEVIGSQYQEAYGKPYAGDITRQPGFTSRDFDDVAVKRFMAEPDLGKKQQAIVDMFNGGQYVVGRLKDNLSGSIQGAVQLGTQVGFTPQVQGAFDNFLSLWQKSPNTARAYYDGEGKLGARLEGFAEAVTRGEDMTVSYNKYMAGPMHPKKLPSTGDTKNALGYLVSKYNGWKNLWMGDNALKPGQSRYLLSEIETDVADTYGFTADLEGSIDRVVNQQASQGLEVMGGYVFRSRPQQTNMADYLIGTAKNADGTPMLKRTATEQNVAKDKINDEFADAVHATVYGDKVAGRKPITDDDGTLRVVRMGDTNRVPTFMVLFQAPGEEAKRAILTADEIPKRAAAYRKRLDSPDQLPGETREAMQRRNQLTGAPPVIEPQRRK